MSADLGGGEERGRPGGFSGRFPCSQLTDLPEVPRLCSRRLVSRGEMRSRKERGDGGSWGWRSTRSGSRGDGGSESLALAVLVRDEASEDPDDAQGIQGPEQVGLIEGSTGRQITITQATLAR